MSIHTKESAVKANRRAFSLVEMLVAIVLISLLIGIAMFSFRLQLITVKKTKEVGINEVLHFNQLRASLSSVKFYVVDDYDMLGFAMKKLHFYFDGTPDEIDYITTNPLFSDDIAVVKLICKEEKLVYKEEPLYGNIDFLRPQVLEQSRETVLFKNLSLCNFGYIYNRQKRREIHNNPPSSVIISLETKKQKKNFYVNVKSDYNISKGIIQNVIYPVE